MRVPDGMMSQFVSTSLAQISERMQQYQTEIASGIRIQRPSDDPGGAVRAANLRSGLQKLEQYRRSGQDAAAWLSSEDSALNNLQNALRQIRTAAVAGNNPQSADARETLANQISTTAGTVLQSLNASDGSRFLFGGHRTMGTPFTGTAPGAVTYQGDAGVRRVLIGDGNSLDVNHAGDELVNLGGAADATLPDIFQTIAALTTAVSNGDQAGISAGLTQLDAHMQRVNDTRSETGVKLQQVELSLDRITQSSLVLNTQLSDTEGADLTDAVVKLKAQENLYQAATYVSSKLVQGGLLSWL